MLSSRAVRALLTGFAFVLVPAGGCGAPPGESRQEGGGDRGATLTFAAGYDVGTFFEWFSPTAIEQEIRGLVFRPLAEFDPAEGRFVPQLASSWSYSDDGRLLDVTLAEGAAWHDGTPVTSRDVVFTHRVQTDPEAGWIFAGDKSSIVFVEEPDARTVRFRFAEPYAESLFDAMLGFIYPAHLLDGIPVAELTASPLSSMPVGSGPYRVAQRRQGVATELVANAAYHRGAPRIERILFRVVDDKESRGLLFEAGEVDLLRLASPQQVLEYEADDAVTLHEVPFRKIVYLAWNARRPPFDDVRVRRALSMAIDRERIRQVVLDGRGALADGPLPPGSWARLADPPVPRGGVEDGRRLLESAGWRTGPDGVRTKNGARLSFELVFAGNARLYEDTATLVRENLALLGAEARVARREGAVFMKDLDEGAFDVVLISENAEAKVDLSWIASRRGLGAGNYAGWIDAEADAACSAGRSAGTREAALPHWHAVQRRLASEQPYTYLVWRPEIHIVGPRVSGATIGPRGLFATITSWEIDGAGGPGGAP